MSLVIRLATFGLLAFCLIAPVVDSPRAYAYETLFSFVYPLMVLFLIGLSLYSSPVAQIQRDVDGTPLALHRRAALRRRLLGGTVLLLLPLMVAGDVLYASRLEPDAVPGFYRQFELPLFALVALLLPIGACLYYAVMCPYCRNLNQSLRTVCEGCRNEIG